MPSDQRYEAVPPIPTYDEAVSSGSSRWRTDASPVDDRSARETESQSLLTSSGAGGSSRRTAGYRPPTVETDDEDSDWSSDDDDDETTQVRRELEEMEIEEAEERSRSSIWGKRMPFSLSLPKWKWTWRWRIPRPSIRLPSRPEAAEAGESEEGGGTGTGTGPRWEWPKVQTATALLLFARILAVFVVIGILYIVFASDVFSGMARRMGGRRPTLEDLKIYLMEHVELERMRASVKMFSSYAHMAGSEGDYAHAMDVEEMFIRAGMDVVVVDEYEAYLNFPTPDGRAVEIMDEDGETAVWTAQLDEEERGGEQAGHQTLVFHGHAKSADVKGPLIYANYGSREDFKKLQESGVETEGAIALVRYYGTPEDLSLKVLAAEMAGFAGCIVYVDPADTDFVTGHSAPSDRQMPADTVERGSVSLTRFVLGDVLTPGWGSKKDSQRVSLDDAEGLVKIPSLPLAHRDAQVLLQRIRGFGQRAPDEWVGRVPGISEWWTGNLSSPIVRLKNELEMNEKTPIRNVYGKIQGYETGEKSVMIGNHRDAWAFGATDPAGGTAVMIELARIFGQLRAQGWVPLRSIEFMSWDAKEYNMIGSTEFVEHNEEVLRENAYAYINIDDVVMGSEIHAAGSPIFNRMLLEALDRVWDPSLNSTLKELWNQRGGYLETLDCKSDYLPFQTIAGTSSLHLSFQGERYPKHSSYNNFDWVNKVIDPGFIHHRQMAELVGILTLDVAERYIIPFDVRHYGDRLAAYVDALESWAKNMAASQGSDVRLDVRPLSDAVGEVRARAEPFAEWEQTWESIVFSHNGWESSGMGLQRIEYNDRMAHFETDLLDPAGIPDRIQYKHVVFGPSRWDTDPETHFPAIRQHVEDGKWKEANDLVEKTAIILRNAAANLLA